MSRSHRGALLLISERILEKRSHLKRLLLSYITAKKKEPMSPCTALLYSGLHFQRQNCIFNFLGKSTSECQGFVCSKSGMRKLRHGEVKKHGQVHKAIMWCNQYSNSGRRCQHSLKCPPDPRISLIISIPLQPIVQSNPCLKSWLQEWFLSWANRRFRRCDWAVWLAASP
ncbi:uncharacterized protein LOC126079648 isoform X2 [Elephas maximus indicus]|uniref:uncharacterized protein LOC126079648 isoform X2 n=1 Tax=Elephas maximus indicus TaxID=99487 RepID=UPI00211622C5|nr:uncharacterized protein LOC126079648 isoform X2 [Elephas maximus indicus]